MNEEVKQKNSTIVTVLITLLVVALIGCISFIVYDKVIKKEEVKTEENNNLKDNQNNSQDDNNENNQNSLSDDEIYRVNNSISQDKVVLRSDYIISDEEKSLLSNLVFPFDYINGSGSDLWSTEFKEFNFDKMSRDERMTLVASLIELSAVEGTTEPEYECTDSSACYIDSNGNSYEFYVTEKDMKNMYVRLYGTEEGYSTGDINIKTFNVRNCPSLPYKYDSITNRYFGSGRCGGDVPDDYYNVITKVEKDNNEIYVYVAVGYVQQNQADETFIIFPFNNRKNQIRSIDDYSKVDSNILSLSKQGKLDTYSFTFKKQNDGNYYVYSGEWQ